MKWYKFKAHTPGNRQRLPKQKKYVLVKLKNQDTSFRDPVVVGYLRFHADIKSEPYFVTPGASGINTVNDDSRVIAWSDCLPDDFIWPKFE